MEEIARFKMPMPLRLFGDLCKAINKAYPDSTARQEGEWWIIEKPKTETP